MLCRQHNAAAAAAEEPPGGHGEAMGESVLLLAMQSNAIKLCSVPTSYTVVLCYRDLHANPLLLPLHMYPPLLACCSHRGDVGSSNQRSPGAAAIPQPFETTPLAVQDSGMPDTGGAGGRPNQQR